MILVTGGAGFIGSHLVAQLAESGELVRVFDLPNAPVSHLPTDRIELVHGNICDPDDVNAAVSGCEYVYHLAADPNLWRRDRRRFDAVNHIGTVNVMRAAVESGAKRILYTGTESILTSRRFVGGSVENLQLHERDMLGPYCLSKFRAERAALELAAAGAPIVVVTPTLPVGPGDRRLTPPTRMTVAFCRGALPAIVDCRLNLIDARDVATGMRLAMERGRTGVRYLLGGSNCRLSEWLGVVGEIVGRPAPRFRVPYPVALAVAYGSEFWADNVSHRMPMATVTGVRLTRRSMHFDPSPTLAELGLEPRDIGDSARDAIAWYREQGWI